MKQSTGAKKRLRYAAPKVTLYGSMALLTAAGSKGGSEGSAGMNDPLLMA